MSSDPRSVVVIGAGILGLATAARLVAQGARVIVLSLAGSHRTASLRSFSWLNSLGRHTASYQQLREQGLQRYRALAQTLGEPAWLRFSGSLSWVPEGDGAALKMLHTHLMAIGYPVQWLSQAQASRVEPALAMTAISAEGVLNAPNEGWVDLPPLLDVLRRAVVDAGGIVQETARAPWVRTSQGAVDGVVLHDGTMLDADAVVVAAGAATPSILRENGLTMPARSTLSGLVWARVRGNCALTSVVRTPAISVRPCADGSLVLHADAADVQVQGDETQGYRLSAATVASVLEDTRAMLAGAPKLDVLGVGAGLRPIPGDGHPVVGALPNIPGYYVAFSHSAATLGPLLGELLADEILEDTVSPLLADFRPDRFFGEITFPSGASV